MRHAARVATKLALGAPAAPVAHTNLKFTVVICGHKLINKMLVLAIFQQFLTFMEHFFDIIFTAISYFKSKLSPS